jgi:ABC-type multidrug transport system fused ATPase/permease subunit
VAAEARDRRAGDRRGTGFELSRDDSTLLLGSWAWCSASRSSTPWRTFLSDYWLNRSGEQIVHDLRTATYEHLQTLSLAFHSNRPTGTSSPG